jgi:hypothetical protein
VSAESIGVASEAVGKAIEALDHREARWLVARPWQPIPERLESQAQRIFRQRALAASLLLIVLAGAAFGLVAATRDPLRTKDVVSELRELNPGAQVVNCRGASGPDHWTCAVGGRSCRTAAANAVPCGQTVTQRVVDVVGDARTRCVLEHALRSAAKRAGVAGAIGCLHHKDPPADLGGS